MVDSLVSTTVTTLNTILQDEVVLLVCVTNEIKRLSSTFTSIRAVLKDAETQRLKNDAVKDWLEKLKDVAYDVDDILDEWKTEALKSQAPDEDGGSCFSFLVTCYLSCVTFFNHVVFRHKIGSGIKEVRGRLDDIAKEMSQFHFITREVDGEVRRGEIRDRETSSVLDQPFIVGREDVKKRVVELLLGGSSREVNKVPFVISIVGMGGLGKTTLAQLIYNDENVIGHFHMRMWVCVSEDFDVKRITKSIIESATRKVCKLSDLDPLQRSLHDMLQAKRFLLVLDDVWSHDSKKWDKLRGPFQAGAPGSRIIVTTRSEDVASRLGSTDDHMQKLDVLSDDDCWSVFSRTALEHRSAEERSDLEEIGRQIVNRCGGVPLAAKTIGSAMRKRKTRRQWELVLRSEVWKSGDVLGGILPALLLSYHDLPPALKQCFTYLSIFPKDWEIKKDTIVKLWEAQGFICSEGSEDMEEIGGRFICSEGSEDMEEIGGRYFDDLLSRSLLQDAELDRDKNVLKCKMHDLVHDLAQSVAGSECSLVEMRKQSSLNLNNLRHLFLIDSDDAGDRDDKADEVASIWATLYEAQKLRTLLHDSTISRVPNNLFNHFRHLRALDLSRTSIQNLPRTVGKLKHLRYLDLSQTGMEELPEEVSNCRNLQTLKLYRCGELKKLPRGMGKMKHLRYLDLSWTEIEELPEEVSNCRNLQTLELNCCDRLKKLPRGMGKMISLRHLELTATGELKYLPQGIGKLSSLRTLRKFIVGGDDEGCKWGELKHLNHLQGSLLITGFENVRNRDEAREAELNKKQYLHSLTFEYVPTDDEASGDEASGGDESSGDEASGDDEQKRTEEVLEILQPHTNLKELEIAHYKGSKLPKWTEDPVFSNLVKVQISYCDKCKQLPGLGKLPSLKDLSIWGMKEVRKVGGEFSGDDNNGSGGRVVSFPKLESLAFLNMRNWEEWELRGGDDGEVMPSLLKLQISQCPKLKALPSNLPPLLQKLTLIASDVEMSSGVPLPVLPNLNHLVIGYDQELTSFPSVWLGQLKALQTLEIKRCPKLRSLPEELQHLTMLQQLKIERCPELRSLPEELQHLTMLQKLKIGWCPELRSLPEELQHLTMLQKLKIGWCPELRSLPVELQHLTMLQILEIRYCPELRSLPEELQHLTMLQRLFIIRCPGLDERCREGGEDRYKIAHIPNILVFP